MSKNNRKPFFVYSIVSLVILYVGLLCSSLFWSFFVNDQFGLIIPFTFLFLLLMDGLFKIPAFIDIILLTFSKGRSIPLLILNIVSLFLTAGVDFLLLLNTHGSNL